MVKRGLSQDTVFTAVVYVFLTLIAAVMLYPILNILAVSMSDYVEFVKHPWMLIPRGVTFDAYVSVFKNSLIYQCYGNTIFITLTGTLIGLAVTTMTAYPLSRPETKGKAVYMMFIIFTMMFSAGMIPNFLNIRNLGMYNTHWALILPGTFTGFNCILMINFFKNIPSNLIEAAKIDGANELHILCSVVLPLSGSVIATITLFKAVGYWNSYTAAQIYLKDRELWPIALLLKEILLEARTNMLDSGGNLAEVDSNIPAVTLQYAMLIVSMLPIMCVYPFLQKYFAKGVLVGAVKG